MTYFYTNNKSDIKTSTEDLLLFSSIVKKEIIQSQGSKELIILRPDRPDLVMAVLLACQEETDEILITKSDQNDPVFLKQFHKVQTIESHHLVEHFERFQKMKNETLEMKNETALRQKICQTNKAKIWFRSSGSSGTPKYIQHSFSNFINSTKLTYQSYLHVVKNINWALNLTIDHIGGFMALFRSFYLGHNVQHFFWKEPSEKDHANVFSFVPTQVHWILERPDSPAAHLLKNAEMVIISGGEISNALIKNLKSFKQKGHVVFTYGATETCSQIAVGFYKKDIEAIEYRPFESVTIESKDNKTIIHSPTNCNQLWEEGLFNINFVELSDEININPENGRFSFKGRTDQMIVSGGENISLNKVKEALNQLFPQETITLIGSPDEKWGTELICFSQNKIELSEIKQELLNLLSAHEVPKSFYSISKVHHEGVKPSKDDLIRHHKINKYPWIAFHGFMGTPDDWVALETCGIENILKIDLNDFLDASSWKDTSDWIISKLENLFKEEQKFNLIGYSMGARVLLSIVRPLRERLNQVVIISSQFGDLLVAREKLERKAKDEALLTDITDNEKWDEFISKWYELDLFAGLKEHDQFPELLKRRQFDNIENYRKQLLLWTVATMPNYLMTYPKELISKTLLITGEADLKYSNYAKDLSAKKNIPHKTIKGHSHALLTSAPNEIYECLISLISI